MDDGELTDFEISENNTSIKFEEILRFRLRNNDLLQLLFFFGMTGIFIMNVFS